MVDVPCAMTTADIAMFANTALIMSCYEYMSYCGVREWPASRSCTCLSDFFDALRCALSLDAALRIMYCLNMHLVSNFHFAWLVMLTNSSPDDTKAVCSSACDTCTEFPAYSGQDRDCT